MRKKDHQPIDHQGVRDRALQSLRTLRRAGEEYKSEVPSLEDAAAYTVSGLAEAAQRKPSHFFFEPLEGDPGIGRPPKIVIGARFPYQPKSGAASQPDIMDGGKGAQIFVTAAIVGDRVDSLYAGVYDSEVLIETAGKEGPACVFGSSASYDSKECTYTVNPGHLGSRVGEIQGPEAEFYAEINLELQQDKGQASERLLYGFLRTVNESLGLPKRRK